VYPNGLPETFCTDHWRCRFTSEKMDKPADYSEVIQLTSSISGLGLDIIKTENLYRFDGKLGFSLAQGQ
ncbi:MAG: NADP-dependent isocitrate dehydrogenase, partial [Cytophagales bacterium]|nr:NADP-dependent isocitrate dehydrogenase [Cytophagales bacterium]